MVKASGIASAFMVVMAASICAGLFFTGVSYLYGPYSEAQYGWRSVSTDVVVRSAENYTIDIKLYSDKFASDPLTTIDWGTIVVTHGQNGTAETKLYVHNEHWRAIQNTTQLSMEKDMPLGIAEHLSVTWDFNQYGPLKRGVMRRVYMTLTVHDTIISYLDAQGADGEAYFSVDIVMVFED